MNNQHLYNFNNDDEWYTTREDVIYFLVNANIPKHYVIWCPFDNDTSNFVKVLKDLGYKVINSHIDNGQDFYNYEPAEHWDMIISNPPFKGKTNILKRLKDFNKPWALIFGIQAFNTGTFIETLNEFENPNMVFMKRRMRFTKDHVNYQTKDLSYPSFNSMWVCNNVFDKQLLFWEGVKYGR